MSAESNVQPNRQSVTQLSYSIFIHQPLIHLAQSSTSPLRSEVEEIECWRRTNVSGGSIYWFSKFSDKWSFVWIVNGNSVKLQWYMIHILMIQWKVYQEEEQDWQCLTNSMQLEVNCSMFFKTDGNMLLWRLSLHSLFLVSTTFSFPFDKNVLKRYVWFGKGKYGNTFFRQIIVMDRQGHLRLCLWSQNKILNKFDLFPCIPPWHVG